MIVVAGVLGLVAGAALMGVLYASELRRVARLLHERPHTSNARVTLRTQAPGVPELARAINDELDATVEERLAAARRDAEFRRDLSALSHDIRTPLMGAKGFLELAEDEGDAAACEGLLAQARVRLDGVEALLNQLFSYAKAADPELAVHLGPVALDQLVSEVLVGHYPEFERLDWEPEVAFAPEAAVVDADAEQLTRVVENLVSNALRYGVAAPCVRTSRVGERRVRLEVANRVANPRELDASRLFDRFYRADAARGGGGAGLGLSVAAKLAEAMHMSIAATLEGDELTVSLEMEAGVRADR